MISFDEFDEQRSPRPDHNDFSRLLQRAVSRRGFLKTGAAFGVSAFVSGTAMHSGAARGDEAKSLLGFSSVAANSEDTITVPAGYQWHAVASWGDPLFSDGAAFDHKTRGSGASQERAVGDNTDGMKLFHLSEDEGVLATNNEYVNRGIIHPDGVNNADDVRKSKAGHGVSVYHIKRNNGKWSPVIDGKYNRRITADTPMEITGPARGHALLKTKTDATGTTSKGTWNNCGNGWTPWGTYLACEENFNGYYASSDPELSLTAEQQRYGIGHSDWGYDWYKFDDRFDLAKDPQESNRSGYVVEIDLMDPNSTPKKRSALGRFKHENAELVIADSGQVVVYMGDDERGEFLYRFISRARYKPDNMRENRELLAEGRLYVARFGEADEQLAGNGKWIELTAGKNGLDADNGFATQAEICIHSRVAASLVGATTMDRPEWVAAHPHKAEIYCCLTNNKNRGLQPNRGGDDTPVGGPNPREANLYGQIVRWRPHNGDHISDSFDWDLFVLAGNPAVHSEGLKAGSDNITADNLFNSPDGISFDPDGRLWIQTDGKYTDEGDFAGMGNNQMLCGDTGSGEVRRFLVGPKACEITGITWSQDYRTMFVGVQHPGENDNYPSSFPGGPGSTPRSTVVAISRIDGGVIGS